MAQLAEIVPLQPGLRGHGLFCSPHPSLALLLASAGLASGISRPALLPEPLQKPGSQLGSAGRRHGSRGIAWGASAFPKAILQMVPSGGSSHPSRDLSRRVWEIFLTVDQALGRK